MVEKMSQEQETAVVVAAPTIDAASARKRRKAIIQSQRSEAESAAPPADAGTDGESGSDRDKGSEGEPPTKKAKGKSKGDSRSKQARKYVPDVPMGKEQLAAWRREARRVRNRESAAASRQRIRNRITELEDEVGEWKMKYEKAMERLQVLEEKTSTESTGQSNGER